MGAEALSERIHTYCRVCEPACGLVATVEDGKLERLEPDRAHPVTKGFACPKGLAGVDINHDPDRLNFPSERVGGERLRRTWDDAIDAIASRLGRVVAEHGPRSVAVYLGNPASFNCLVGVGMPEVFRHLGVTRKFSSATQDCVNKWAASAAVFGATALHPIPDVRNADVILQLGSNWRTSKASFLALPNAYGELMAARRRGATIYFVNPRDAETAGERTGETVPIKPDTDTYFLAALLNVIDDRFGFRPASQARWTNLERLREFVQQYRPSRVATVCGLPSEQIVEIAERFATADRAAAYISTGVNMGRQGTLAYWLLHMLVFVTDNLDRTGGNIPGTAFYDLVAKTKSNYEAGGVDGEFGPMRMGDIPGGLLADYILDADDPIKALVVIAGNPLLSIPGEARLRRAFEALELLVSIDIYPTATSEYSHWALPATDQFEREDVDISHVGMQVEAHVQSTPRVAEPQFERREEWWMFGRLAQALGLPSVLDEPDPLEARWRRIDHMLARGGLTRAQLNEAPHGMQLGDGLQPGRLFDEMVHTPDGRIDCCPEAFGGAIERCHRIFAELDAEPAEQLKLITRRDSRMHNSWYANLPGMKAGKRTTNRLAINPVDAARLGVDDGGLVRVSSAWGEVEVEAEHDARLRTGVVSLEHGWGRQAGLALARSHPGVNVNIVMPHGPDSFEPASNQQQLTGVAVEVRRV
jgi:formate dehydrogenase